MSKFTKEEIVGTVRKVAKRSLEQAELSQTRFWWKCCAAELGVLSNLTFDIGLRKLSRALERCSNKAWNRSVECKVA